MTEAIDFKTYECFSAIEEIVENHQAAAFVWPSEGELTESEVWVFDEDLPRNANEPLLVDVQSANVMVQVLERVTPEASETIKRRMANSRAEFIHFMKKCWNCVN